ncbi:MAG: RraA family protein [Firmicutes bacterium]|nr:RraA family protein [Bacillota bacterium]
MDEHLSLSERFSKVYTGAVSDILDRLGYRNQVLPRTLRGLTPGANVCGFALTAYGETSTSQDPDAIFVPILKMLGDVGPNQVVITQANDTTCSHLGELSATTIKARGGVGAVIYGGVRDVDYIQKLGLDVFCLYTTPADVLGRWCLVDYNVPIVIENVKIHPMDIVLGDKDGVLVVPHPIAFTVLEQAEELVGTENSVRRDVMNGVHPLDAYHTHGWF